MGGVVSPPFYDVTNHLSFYRVKSINILVAIIISQAICDCDKSSGFSQVEIITRPPDTTKICVELATMDYPR